MARSSALTNGKVSATDHSVGDESEKTGSTAHECLSRFQYLAGQQRISGTTRRYVSIPSTGDNAPTMARAMEKGPACLLLGINRGKKDIKNRGAEPPVNDLILVIYQSCGPRMNSKHATLWS